MRTFLTMAAATAALCILVAGSALAGPAVSLAADPHAYVDPDLMVWSGTAPMVNGDLSASVDWCVYAPGQYPGTDYTPASNEFVYAYQVFSNGTDGVSDLSVLMLESNKAHNIGHDATIGLPGTTLENIAAFSAGPLPWNNVASWDWYVGIGTGESSLALVYSTINAPLMLQGRVQDGGRFALGDMASPSNLMPEPATLALLAGGLAMAFRRRR